MRKFLLAVSIAATLTAAVRAATCESVASLKLPDTSINTAQDRPGGDFTPPGGRPIRNPPAFCRVAGVIRPSADSEIRFEVWLPANWSGRFEGIGNGGYGGAIGFPGLANAVRKGNVGASTDTGHEDSETSAKWALNHPEKIIDFGYRAIHLTTTTARAITTAFYGQVPKRSYFISCSNGGRQGLMEAQRYPADYDGIIAGAPANDWTHLMAGAAYVTNAVFGQPSTRITPAKLQAVEAAFLSQCDALDGLKDGIVEDPRACRFDPAVLLCEGEASDSCLTDAQLTVLKTIYGGAKNRLGRQVFPGVLPGGEAQPGGWATWIAGDDPEKTLISAFAIQFFRYMVFNDPNWQFRTFDLNRDAAAERLTHDLDATDADLSQFQRHGGKLILYHGWADPAVPPLNTVQYYESVKSKSGANSNEFLRLYMVPGMLHCRGGDGPNDFGQGNTSTGDASHNVVAALEAWAENGSAPGQIMATNPNAKGGAARTRPICPWPEVAKYVGSGSAESVDRFVCAQ